MKLHRHLVRNTSLILLLAGLAGCGTPQNPSTSDSTGSSSGTAAAPAASPSPSPLPSPSPASTSEPSAAPSETTAAAGDVAKDPCGPPPTGNFDQRAGENGEFCVLWKDAFSDEQGFRVRVEYGSMEQFSYDLPANTTSFVLPNDATPQAGSSKCARSSFSITVEALQTSGATLVDGMAMDAECQP